MKKFIALAAAVSMSTMSICAAASEGYPSKPVTIVLPVSAGSATDGLIRVIADKLGKDWLQSIIVKNEPGANGILATQTVLRSRADGYTLFALSTNQVINANLYTNLPFNTQKDLKPIARVAMVPMVLCVNPSVPAKTVQQLIALAKREPGKLNFGSPGTGSTAHLAVEQLKDKTGIKVTHVPYKAVSQAQTDLIGGQLDFMFIVPSAAMAQMQAGKLRCLGVGSQERLAQMPNVPTIAESGVPGFEAIAWIGLAGQAGLPDAVADDISKEVMHALENKAIQKRIAGLGLVPAGMGRQPFTAYYNNDFANWHHIIEAAGIRMHN
ncbi:Bug family tripartite tricarboxylate transporter substrate binding protein [Candidimonas nitroreducens]|uniref:LacI family transcriptional regulator n=1 Tax=Candidimonas nitroreducens TaxID=683354 RepID=A0A225M6I3_9BURK|nr:tripartite tricarboxylate transporter substrate binding protein [Candidimonas nitroreducens]OWT55720.1 LacI family transcriptional regulator [Candidimonas nitroreducens]